MQTLPITIYPKLSKASKMPCESLSLPAQECITGRKLAEVKGSVCEGCYAMKGRYVFDNVKKPRYTNLEAIQTNLDDWIVNTTHEIKRTNSSGYFRWHDSGDLQSLDHLKAIVKIAQATPNIRHWLPTKEKQFLNQAKREGLDIPENLTIRLSMPMLNDAPKQTTWELTSTVRTKDGQAHGVECKSYEQQGKCLTCRTCWDKEVQNITYLKH